MFLNLDQKAPSSEAVVDGDGLRLTYGDLLGFCGTFAGYIAPRELIFIISENAAGS